MRSLDNTNRISELLARFVASVKISGALNYTDSYREAQNVLVPLFRIIFKYPGLKNLDVSEHQNYPAIDLADDTARVAFQVTSDESGPKIKDTLQKFATHKLYKIYDRLIVYILKEKQERYESDFSGIVPAPFQFDKARDILDYTNLLPLIKALSPNEQQQILDLLEDEFGREGWSDYVLKPEIVEKHQQVYVPPVQIENALTILRREGIVILIGPPHIGKTEAGIELLLRLSEEKQFGNVLHIEEFNDWKRLSEIRQRAVLLDDAFGKLSFDNPMYGNHFNELRELAGENLIVITSRQDIFETARTKTRMGESGMLSNLIVELTPGSAYGTNALHQILEKHVHYARTYKTLQSKLLLDNEANLLLMTWRFIVQQLRFPHNIEWLVSNASGRLREPNDLLRLTEEAKDIEAAFALWYGRQEEALQIFAAVVALYPYMLADDMEEAYRLVCVKRSIPFDDVKRKARQSAGYISADAHVAFTHPSYGEGVKRGLKEQSFYFIKDLLEARAEYLLNKPLLTLLQYRRENNDKEQNERILDYTPPSQMVDVEQWFSDYVNAYNNIISRDFLNMRTFFYPEWNGEARIHLLKDADGEPTWWACLRQDDSKPIVSSSVSDDLIRSRTRPQVEQEAIQTPEQKPIVWHSYSNIRNSIPQIEAMSQVLNQIVDTWRKKPDPSEPFLAESWQLRIARLLLALESAGFPLDTLDSDHPLTIKQLEEWATPFCQFDEYLELPPGTKPMRRVIYQDIKRINDLIVPVAVEDFKVLEATGHLVTGEFLLSPDLTADNYLQYPSGTTHSDFYTDARLVEAVTYGMQMYYESYKVTVERSFPTLYSQMPLYSKLPIGITCVIERDMPYEVNPKSWTQRKPTSQSPTLRLHRVSEKGFPCPDNAGVLHPPSRPKSLCKPCGARRARPLCAANTISVPT